MVKTCVTQTRQIVQEYINGYIFEFSAGEFFQNNNSILPIVIDYVRSNLSLSEDQPNYLVDAYCGSGLFSITCSSNVSKVIGVEISADSIRFAKRNAEKTISRMLISLLVKLRRFLLVSILQIIKHQ